MKRLAIVALCVMLCGCGKEELRQPEGYVFYSGGVEIAVGMDADVVVSRLGERVPFVSESCGNMGGNDYEYDYEDFTIFANDGGGNKEIYCVVLESDLVKTAEDIVIGDTQEDVTGVYGEPKRRTDTALIYEKGAVELTFVMKEGLVRSIQYLKR